MKLPRYRRTGAPTHFQKQVGRGTWVVDDWHEALKKFTDSMPCVRCAFGFALYIFLELSTTYVTMSYMFLECVCFQHLISASFSIVG